MKIEEATAILYGEKITPGPWKVVNHWITDESELVTIASLPKEIFSEKDNRSEANARLIAASPCLLAALKDCLTVLTADSMSEEDNAVEIAQARAALDKAERGQS